MTFPFVSILPSVDEVKNELKNITKSSSYSEEDIYGWMVEASRLIGSASFEPANAYLAVKKHVAILPKTFYLLDDILLCEHVPEMGDTDVRRYIPTRVMRPADAATRNLCSEGYNVNYETDLSYTFKIPPGIARLSFNEGMIYIEFQQMKVGEDKAIMVQDEPNTLKALKCYSKMMLLHEKYILQQIPQYVYRDITAEWNDYCENAQRILKFPPHSENSYNMLRKDARYRSLRYKDQ